MGNKISSITAIAGIDSYVSELGDVYYERSIGNARFMKTIRGRHKDGMVVVKIFVKPDLGMSLQNYVKRLQEEYDALVDVPNVFMSQRILETERAAYMVRQYFYSSLYDRISTRPFLTLIEKKWIAYQILKGISEAHKKNVYHGDIKTENVLVTSWNWAYIVDFASFKPTYLPEDNPADFSFFFDMSSRRSCYIAPERFYKAGTAIDQKMKNVDFEDNVSELTPEMDIFSVGCVIAELFLEGTSIFSLSQLFKYRSGEYKPDSNLNKIEDKHIRDMVRHMIQIDPKKRYSAKTYLQKWRGKAFPKYFDTFLHEYINSVTENNGTISIQQHSGIDTLSSLAQALPGTAANNKRMTDADEKIEHIHNDFDKITFNVSFKSESDENLSGSYNKRLSSSSDSSSSSDEEPRMVGLRRRTISDLASTTASAIILPPTLNIPNYEPSNVSTSRLTNSNKTEEHGYLILLSFVCSLIRNTSYPSSKLKALDILLALGEHLPDDVKLDRLVPYLMALLSDETALVRANAIKTLTQVLCMVESISPINARIFPEYILPSVREFATDPDVLVRTTYASCIALLAETALRFLEMTQLLKNDSAFPLTDMDTEELDFESAYDSSLNDLHSVIQEQVTVLLIDNKSSVKRALLTNITCLCGFFGRQKTNDVLLSHMITYLNDKDWMLRSAFFESIKGVGTFVGSRSLEEYILPLMIQALTDAEEFVVESVLNSLTSLSDLDLFEKMKSWELVGIIAPLICHPSVWIQYGAIGFISSTAKNLSQTDIWCIIYPLLKPFLRSDISEINETCLLQSIKTPLPRQVYEQAIAWANKASVRSLFWKPQLDKRSQSNSSSKSTIVGPAMKLRQGSLFSSSLPEDQIKKSEEDEMFIDRLRKVGMSTEDEERLGYMRDYIYKVSQSKLSRPKQSEDLVRDNGEIFLKNLGVTPMTVFLPDLSQEAHVWNVKTYKNLLKPKSDRDSLPTKLAIPQHVKEDDCKLNRVASQPHVQALLYNSQGNNSDNDNKQSSSPIPSPTEYNFGMDIHNMNTSRKKGSKNKKKYVPDNESATTLSIGASDGLELRPVNSAKSRSDPDSESVSEIQRPPVDMLSRSSSAGYGHLQGLLHSVAMDAFSPHIPEFIGDPAVMKRMRRLPQGTSPFRTISNWKPEGTLVAHFTEHTAAINQLAISWDNLLFASCSDDGSVKIWDCSRLERNVTNRSRATYNQQGGRIKCLTFIQQTYCIAAASDNGSVNVFRVDIRNTSSGLKFGKCITVREHQLVDEYALVIKHFTSNASNAMAGSKSFLMFATTKGNIYAMDLLTMEIVWKLKNPKSHGVITSMVTDRLHTWLLVGTVRGILTLYDLRFQIPLRSWLHPSKSRISTMMLNHDPKAESKQVIIAAGRNEVSVWDIVDLRCVEVFAVKSGDEKTAGVVMEAYKALEVPSDAEIMSQAFTSNEANLAENSIRAVASPSDCRFIITGGSDRKLRFWDIPRVENSCVILGLEIEEPKPRYSMNTHESIKFHYEFTHAQRNNHGSSASLGARTGFSTTGQTGGNSAVIQQHHLMRNHTDAITDVVLTEVPYPMVISGDRDGVIKVIS
ncbi:hypothetical protein CLU79DRAFT_733513 [Phycomyces nitens]|nr:hypothetical protein CLU79DRAFT_733513 [Phycomyces nitens]